MTDKTNFSEDFKVKTAHGVWITGTLDVCDISNDNDLRTFKNLVVITDYGNDKETSEKIPLDIVISKRNLSLRPHSNNGFDYKHMPTIIKACLDNLSIPRNWLIHHSRYYPEWSNPHERIDVDD